MIDKEITHRLHTPRRSFMSVVVIGLLLAVQATRAIAQAAPQSERAELEKRIARQTLDNGLEVIVVPNPGVPLVTIEADVKNGSFTQGPGFEGLSHLYEHMFFKANADYPEPDEFVARASELGAVFNGSTTEERVNYYLTLPADSAEGGMRFLASALEHPLFRADELQREREVVIGEYDRNESEPFYHFNRAMGQALWGSAWSRKNPLGERSVILATTPERMRAIQQLYYVPNNSALIITGDIDVERAFALAKSVYGSWPRGADPFVKAPIPPIPPLTKDSALIVQQPIGNAALIMIEWQGPSARKDPAATYAADVFSDVLNQPGSDFQKRLVDSGICESAGVNYYTQNYVGPITVTCETTSERVARAVPAIDSAIARVTTQGYFSADVLNGIKQQRIAGTMYSLERASGFAQQIGFWWAVTGLDYFLGYVDTMSAQTANDLRSYASKYIVGKPRVVGLLASPEAVAASRLTTASLLPHGAAQ